MEIIDRTELYTHIFLHIYKYIENKIDIVMLDRLTKRNRRSKNRDRLYNSIFHSPKEKRAFYSFSEDEMMVILDVLISSLPKTRSFLVDWNHREKGKRPRKEACNVKDIRDLQILFRTFTKLS